MKVIETSLPGVLLIEPTVISDERGFFLESYNQARFADLSVTNNFIQDNHSKSVRDTLRGLHYQLRHPQAKLCRVVAGEVMDVVVDIRLGSSHFGKHMTARLSAANKLEIFVPRGFAHGFVVLSDSAEFLYKCDDFYYKDDERGVAWDDPDLNINWGVDNPILSARDSRHPPLSRIPALELPNL